MAGKSKYGKYDQDSLKAEAERVGELRWSVYCRLNEENVSDVNIRRMFGLSEGVFTYWKKGHMEHFKNKGQYLGEKEDYGW